MASDVFPYPKCIIRRGQPLMLLVPYVNYLKLFSFISQLKYTPKFIGLPL